ncbi:hypothetical protein HNY73_009548 [Argiope bruennichi]|uniref:Uncharacterized protein n=1 Tax=Argiope bruennichi TaxID=94029 RepID=A0A8T0FCM5_ARGBR|nr:hypothetical protein HNY73_009548 [Argiope bruennichi]
MKLHSHKGSQPERRLLGQSNGAGEKGCKEDFSKPYGPFNKCYPFSDASARQGTVKVGFKRRMLVVKSK